MNFEKKLYNVSFNICCINPESRIHSLMYTLPQLEQITFSCQNITDEQWLCKLNCLHSLGIEAINLEKIPVNAAALNEDNDTKIGVLFSELVEARDNIAMLNEEEPDNKTGIAKAVKEYNNITKLLIGAIKDAVIETTEGAS